jgi:capsular exopolysaccharide synthesis family protein
MEDHRESLPNMQSRHLSIRSVRALSELNSFEEPGSPYSVETGERPEESAGLLEYWRLLVRHKTTIIASSIGGLLLGILIGIPLKPIYRASTSLEVLNINEDFMNMRPSHPEVQGGDGDNLSEEETQATLLQSSQLLDRVSARLDLDPTPPGHPGTSGWRSWLHLKDGPKPSAREKLLGAAMSSVKVTNPPRTRILDISVDSADSQLALDFTNTLVQEFIKQNIDIRWASTQQTGDWLSREINDTRNKLRDSEDALQAYARNSGLFFIDGEKQTNVATEKLQEIQQQLSAATADRISKQSVFELARNSPPNSLADVLNDASLQSLAARLDDATRQVASLSAIYNPGYAKLQQAQAEVASLQQAFASHRADLLRRIETDYQSATRREKLLSATYDAQAREVAGQDQRAVQYNILKREVDSSQQLYDTMLQQTKQASIATALHASNVHVVYPAYLLGGPVSPNFRINAELGLCAGFLCSVGFILIRQQTDRTLRQPGEVRQWASLPELGAIPRLQCNANQNARGLFPRRVRVQWSTNGDKSFIAAGRYNSLNLADISNRPIAVPEAFHSTLTSILLAGGNRGGGRVLVFTSAGPADGKTSVVSNIAIAAAAIGKKVLLVDADLRRPRIHDLFGLKNEAGLAELLRSEADWARWPAVAQQTKMAGLSAITAGKPKRGAGILFYSPGFTTLLAKWREAYDLVLLDTPPALPITDARVIGILADGVVLVARAGQTTRDEMVAIQERFAEDRIPLVGYILNDWDPSHSGRAYPYFGSEDETSAKYPA